MNQTTTIRWMRWPPPLRAKITRAGRENQELGACLKTLVPASPRRRVGSTCIKTESKNEDLNQNGARANYVTYVHIRTSAEMIRGVPRNARRTKPVSKIIL